MNAVDSRKGTVTACKYMNITEVLNLKGHTNLMIGSKVTAILKNIYICTFVIFVKHIQVNQVEGVHFCRLRKV